MAQLGSTWIDGFIESAKATGRTTLNTLGKVVPERVSTFLQGFSGSGWRISEESATAADGTTTTRAVVETDDIVVRGTMRVYELVVQQIRAVCGALGISQACGKAESVSEDINYYYITMEGTDEQGWGGFKKGDYLRCQRWGQGSVKGWWAEVAACYSEIGGEALSDNESGKVVALRKSDFTGSILTEGGCDYVSGTDAMTPPAAGDNIVQYGSRTDAARRCAIYLHADEAAQPAMDILFGIDGRDFRGKVRVRLGGGVPGSTDTEAVGLYCVNGCIRAVDASGAVLYEFQTDGSFSLGNGKITYDPAKDALAISGDSIPFPQWVEDWDADTTQIGSHAIVSPSGFFGKKNEDGTLTGLLLGTDIDGNRDKAVGLYALKNSEIVVAIDPTYNQFTFKGEIIAEKGTFSGDLKAAGGTFAGFVRYEELEINDTNSGEYLDNSSEGYIFNVEKTGLRINFKLSASKAIYLPSLAYYYTSKYGNILPLSIPGRTFILRNTGTADITVSYPAYSESTGDSSGGASYGADLKRTSIETGYMAVFTAQMGYYYDSAGKKRPWLFYEAKTDIIDDLTE